MIFGIGAIFVFLLIYGPHLWVKYVLWKHSKEIEGMPGTGGELAEHLIQRFNLDEVSVVEGAVGQDHYNPNEKIVSLSPKVYQGKSLTAIAVAAHEIGHAMQFSRNESVSQLRGKYLAKAFFIKKVGSVMLIVMPIASIILRIPHLMVIAAIVGALTMLASALMYVAILPEEYDASFNKALPLLEEGYISSEHMPAVRQVLRAAALTYVAAAFADILNLWRWLRVIR